MIKLYLVGDESSPKSNSWLAMTNSPEEATRLLDELEGACTYKSITVKQREEK
jgi:hypothetical protein